MSNSLGAWYMCLGNEILSWLLFAVVIWLPVAWVCCRFLWWLGEPQEVVSCAWLLNFTLMIGLILGSIGEHVKHPCKHRVPPPSLEARP